MTRHVAVLRVGVDDVGDGDLLQITTVNLLRGLDRYLSVLYRVEHVAVWFAVCQHAGVAVGIGNCAVVEW